MRLWRKTKIFVSPDSIGAQKNFIREKALALKINTGGKDLVMVFDFDGTITEEDVFDSIFYEFGRPRWREAHRAYLKFEISMEEAYIMISDHFRGSPEEVYSFIRRAARLRKGFKELLERLNRRQIPVMIVSNGFDLYLFHLLDFWKIDYSNIDIRCHHAEIRKNRFLPDFNVHVNLKHDRCLIGKAEILEELKGKGKFACFAGNGLSDTPASRQADLLFARDHLADYCRKNRINFIPFTDFYDVIKYLFGQSG